MPEPSDIFRPHWPEGVEPMQGYSIYCDDDGRALNSKLTVVIANDGDVWVRTTSTEKMGADVRVRTLAGGGHNLRTRQALLWLALAIKLDNEERESRLKAFSELATPSTTKGEQA